jgi:hypothetical protein
MKKMLFAVLFGVMCVVVMTNCDGKMSAKAYNDAVVGILDRFQKYYEEQFDRLTTEGISQAESKSIYDSLAFYTEKWCADIDKMKYPDNAADFHQAIVNYFTYQKDTLLPAVQKMVSCEPGSEPWGHATREYGKLVDRDTELNDAAQDAQEVFAKSINMRLE